MIFIITPGRSGSILLQQLIEKNLRCGIKIKTQSQNLVYHSHQPTDHLQRTHDDTVYFLLRKNLVEYCASHYIANKLKKWHWKHSDSIDLVLNKEKINPDDVRKSIINVYIFVNEYIRAKSHNKKTHLIFYEDWTKNYQIPGFELNLDHDINSGLDFTFVKTKVSKQEAVDCEYLTENVKRFNNGSIYIDVSQTLHNDFTDKPSDCCGV